MLKVTHTECISDLNRIIYVGLYKIWKAFLCRKMWSVKLVFMKNKLVLATALEVNKAKQNVFIQYFNKIKDRNL